MRRTFAVLLLLLSAKSIPETASRPDWKWPFWIRADAAFDRDGNLRESLFSENDLWRFGESRRSARQTEGCDFITSWAPLEHHKANEDLASLTANARLIVAGRVAEIVPGFFYGNAGSALRIEEVRVLKHGSKTPDAIFLFYPYARIRAGGRTYCGEPLDVAWRPAIGDRVLFFAIAESPDPSGRFIRVNIDRELVATSGDRIFGPLGVVGVGREKKTYDEIVAAVRARRRAGLHHASTAAPDYVGRLATRAPRPYVESAGVLSLSWERVGSLYTPTAVSIIN